MVLICMHRSELAYEMMMLLLVHVRACECVFGVCPSKSKLIVNRSKKTDNVDETSHEL